MRMKVYGEVDGEMASGRRGKTVLMLEEMVKQTLASYNLFEDQGAVKLVESPCLSHAQRSDALMGGERWPMRLGAIRLSLSESPPGALAGWPPSSPNSHAALARCSCRRRRH